MRKVALPALALALVLALAAVAHAVTNTYKVSGSTSPSSTKKASSKKPIVIGLKFGYQVGEKDGNRPSPVKTYSIAFDGLRVNTGAIPACAGKKIEAAIKSSKSVKKVCGAKTHVGKGFVKNATGSSSDPSDRSVKCDLNLDLYNEGNNTMALHLHGEPPQCAISVNEVIHAKFKKQGSATALVFNVKPLLLHPLAGLDNAVEDVSSTVKKIKGKKGRGFFEAVGGCKAGKRKIAVTFTSESGQKETAVNYAKC